MEAISEILISLFESLGLYSSSNGLGDHLRGLDVECNDYVNQSIYNLVFLCVFLINGFILLNYYYGLFNRVKFTNLFTWLINISIGALILFLISFIYTNNDFISGNYCQDLSITTEDCIGFGLVSAIFSILWSLIFSFIIKWWSINNKKVPF